MIKHLGLAISLTGLFMLAPAPTPASAQPGGSPVFMGLEIRLGTRPPPRAHREARPQRPAWGFVWVGGAWDWQGGDWVWVGGRWERPERRGVYWVPARYARDEDHWRYAPGHWSHQRVVEGAEYRQWRSDRGERRKARADARRHKRAPAKVNHRGRGDDRGDRGGRGDDRGKGGKGDRHKGGGRSHK